MSDLRIIKKRLLDENKVEKVLEAIGCEYISYSGGRIEAQLPQRFDSNNRRSVQVRVNDDYLSSSIRSRGDFKGETRDIYSLVSYILNDKRGDDIQDDLYNAKSFICNLFGWSEYFKGSNTPSRIDYVAPLRALLSSTRKKRNLEPNPVLPESIMDEYKIKGQSVSFEDWIDEGIPHNIQVMYDVGFDLDSKRIVFPIRNRFGQIVGVKGRIMKTEDAPDFKYLYLYKCNNGLELFNFHFAHPYILQYKKVYIFESEKSCMKAFANGIYNTLAIGASDVTDVQASVIKQLGLDIEVVLCYDEGITTEEIKTQAEKFIGRKVYAMFDTDGLLGKKDSPIDCGIEVWRKLDEDYCFEIAI